MALKPLLMGYTSKCFIDDIQIFLTSYSLSINTNIIKSGGVSQIRNSSGSLNRISLNAVRDCPSYQLSLSFQATYSILLHLFEKLCNSCFHDSIHVLLEDGVLSFEKDGFFDFENCYVNSFSVSVDMDSVVTINLGLSFFSQSFKLEEISDFNVNEHPSKEIGGGNLLIPYYNTGIEYTSQNGDFFDVNCLQNFSFNFSHTITPKYSLMVGETMNGSFNSIISNAPVPSKLVFSTPNVNYQLSYIYYKNSFNVDDYISFESNMIHNNSWQLSLSFLSRDKQNDNFDKTSYQNNASNKIGITCQDCYHDVFTPTVGSKGSANMLNVSGTVYGKITLSN